MWPRNCGPASRHVRRVASLCNCHNPFLVAISSVVPRPRAVFAFAMFLPSLRPPGGGLLKLRLRAGVDKTG
jgi:hypothetical protein